MAVMTATTAASRSASLSVRASFFLRKLRRDALIRSEIRP